MISVMTVSHQCQNFIHQCISSVLNQTYEDWEMLILDDISKDKTRRIIKSFNNDKIKFFETNEKLYCGSAYSFLSKQAKGDIIVILDGDDFIPTSSLSTIKKSYDRYPDLSYIYTQHWECNKTGIRTKLGISSMPINNQSLLESWENKRHCFSHMRTCRSSMLQYELFPENQKYSVDKNMGMMLECYGKGGFLNIPLYWYRVYPGQLTSMYRLERGQFKTKFLKKMRKFREEKDLYHIPIISINA